MIFSRPPIFLLFATVVVFAGAPSKMTCAFQSSFSSSSSSTPLVMHASLRDIALFPDYNRGSTTAAGGGGGNEGAGGGAMMMNDNAGGFGGVGGVGRGYPPSMGNNDDMMMMRRRMMQGGGGGGFDPSFDHYYFGGMGGGGGGFDPRMSHEMDRQDIMGYYSYGGGMPGPMGGGGRGGGGGRINPVKVDTTMGGFDYSSRNGMGYDRRSGMYGRGKNNGVPAGGREFEGGEMMMMGGRGYEYDAMMLNDRMMMERGGNGGAGGRGGRGGRGSFGPDDYEMMMMEYEMFERQQQQQQGGGYDGGGYGGGRMGP